MIIDAPSRTRPAAPALVALLLAGCASAPAAPPHPPMPAPTGASPMVGSAPVEGADFVVYAADGGSASLDALLAGLAGEDVLLLGEEHDDVVGHRLQLEVLRRVLADQGGFGPMATPARAGPTPSGEARPVILSLEMFERDVQVVLDEYLADQITEDHFLRSARPWDNYERDYRPLVELAKSNGVPIVAANAPRRYVNRASRLGRSSLSELSAEARSWLPPLPYPEASEAYLAEWNALMGDAAMHMSGSPLDAQTLWDAAMGEAIAQALERTSDEGGLVVHLAGGFHVENGTGIPEAVAHYRPGTRIRSVAVRAVEDPTSFDASLSDAGDFVVLTRSPAPAR